MYLMNTGVSIHVHMYSTCTCMHVFIEYKVGRHFVVDSQYIQYNSFIAVLITVKAI